MRLIKYWYLEESFDMMKRLGMRNMMKLCELFVMKTYTKGALIHEIDQPESTVYFIKKGHVRIGKENGSGNKTIVHILNRGNIFGETKLMDIEHEQYYAEAMSETQICFIASDTMSSLMQEYPNLHSSVLKISWLKVKKLERRLQDVLYKDTETRIIDFFKDYLLENGKLEEGWLIGRNIFKHKDIAKLTSTSRQTVNNIISRLRSRGELKYDSYNISLKLADESLQENVAEDERKN